MTPPVTEILARAMPDIAADVRPTVAGQLAWVGMARIDAPVSIAVGSEAPVRVTARVDAFVNLTRPDVRGIHMSRLYLHVERALAAEPLSPCSLRRLLADFLASHAGLSDRAMVDLRFDYMVLRQALVSDNSGWKSYPVRVRAQLDRGQFTLELGVDVEYSSTCPCSAALARQLVQDDFSARFAAGESLDRDAVLAWLGTEQGIAATPHSQRSRAEVRARLAPSFAYLPVLALVDRIEDALQTPVQTAVKREDEQAFARRNGENLMFCEDAARRLQSTLDADERIADFWLRASHFESLHAHDAVAVAVKGVPGGFDALA
jgi:GTP cyclohydrolase I